MLVFNDVTFAHPGQNTPYTFNFTLARGQVLGISGISGAGKSTLLDLISGFVEPVAGTIRFDDDLLTHQPPEHRPVSILFQNDNLFDHLSVSKNLALGLPKDVPAHDRKTRIDLALSEVGLDGMAPRRAATLSGGQKQRAALARTLLRATPIILLDEPFTALDPETANDMRQLISALSTKQNWCVVLVSHNPTDIEALATQHLELSDMTLKPVV